MADNTNYSQSVLLAIGSNLDARSNIFKALAQLDKAFEIKHISPAYQSQAVEQACAPDYINIGLIMHTDKSIAETLHICRTIEKARGQYKSLLQVESGHSKLCAIDIDLLAFKNIKGCCANVHEKSGFNSKICLPRPAYKLEMHHLRCFLDIAPDWQPFLKSSMTVAEFWADTVSTNLNTQPNESNWQLVSDFELPLTNAIIQG